MPLAGATSARAVAATVLGLAFIDRTVLSGCRARCRPGVGVERRPACRSCAVAGVVDPQVGGAVPVDTDDATRLDERLDVGPVTTTGPEVLAGRSLCQGMHGQDAHESFDRVRRCGDHRLRLIGSQQRGLDAMAREHVRGGAGDRSRWRSDPGLRAGAHGHREIGMSRIERTHEAGYSTDRRFVVVEAAHEHRLGDQTAPELAREATHGGQHRVQVERADGAVQSPPGAGIHGIDLE